MYDTTSPDAAIVRFLLARFEDEERELRRQVRRLRGDPGPEPAGLRERRRHVLSNRQVLGHVQHLLVLRDLPVEEPVRLLAMNMIRALTSPYADHVSFRPEWLVPARVPEGAQ